MKIGFIWLGNMGGGMSANVLKGGYDLTVHDLRREAATPLLESGADWADTPGEIAAACDIVFTSLPTPREIEAVALGEDLVVPNRDQQGSAGHIVGCEGLPHHFVDQGGECTVVLLRRERRRRDERSERDEGRERESALG